MLLSEVNGEIYAALKTYGAYQLKGRYFDPRNDDPEWFLLSKWGVEEDEAMRRQAEQPNSATEPAGLFLHDHLVGRQCTPQMRAFSPSR